METHLRWIHTSGKSVRIAFLQGFFESAGEIDALTMTIRAQAPSSHIQDIVELLIGLDVEPAIIGTDPPTVTVSLRDVKRIPLLSPVIKDGKYYDVRPL